MDWDLALQVVKQYGPLVLVLAFLLAQGWMRECRLSDRINKLEDEQRKVLLPLVKKCSIVITKNTIIMRRLERIIDECLVKSVRPESVQN
jgi:hypothetical protein